LKYSSTPGVKVCKSLVSALSLYDNCAAPARIYNTPFSIGEYDYRSATGGW
jgi:hypothetical protein